MTHFRYVRIQSRSLKGFGSFGTPISRVMPARLLLIGFLLSTTPFFGQSFLRVTCDSTCLPAFDSAPEDVVVDCDDVFPDLVIPSATTCAETPIVNTPSLTMDATSIVRHSATIAAGDGPDWALWLGGFEAMGHGASDYFVPFGDGIIFEQYANGTARFTGEMVNDSDPNQRFELNVFLQFGMDYEGWTAQGHLPKDDMGLEAYEDWTYYEMVDTLSHLIGRGDFEGDMLYLDHMPTSRLFGYQVGDLGANNRNANFGVSGWFWYRGIMGGQDVVGTGDVNADLENTVTDGPDCPMVEESRRIAMAWSECGHDLIEYKVERLDEEAPMFVTLPALESTNCTSLPDTLGIAAFEVFDACGSELTLSNVDSVAGEPCAQMAYRTWTLTDACGNSTDTLQTVALVDETGPMFEVEDTTIVCDAWDNYETFIPNFQDDCSPADSITWLFADTVTSGFYPFYFTLDRVYTATDLCGNSTSDTMTISVIDTVAPTWTFLPPDTTILCDEWEDYTIIQPTVEDNCDPNPVGPDGEGATDTTITEGECFGEFLVELTFEFTDMSGNTITYVQVIEAVDTIPPTFPYFPPDTVLACDEAWPQPNDAPVWTATVEDNFCPFEVTWEDSISSGACLGTDTLFRVFTAVDDCENTTVQTQTIIRVDTIGPVVNVVPEDSVIACGAPLPELAFTATDNCSGVDSTWVTVDTLDITFGQPVSTGFESCSLDGFVAEGGSISISNDAFDGTCALSMLHAAGDPAHNFYPEDIMAGRGTYRVMARADGFISDNIVEVLGGDNAGDPSLKLTLRPLGTDNPGISLVGFGIDEAADATMQLGSWYEVVMVMGESTIAVTVDGTPVLEAAVPAELPEQGRFKLASAYSGSYDDMAYLPEDPCPVVERLMRTVYAMDGCNNVDSDFQIIDVIDTVAPVMLFIPENADIDCSDPWPMPSDSELLMATAEDACTDVQVTWSDEIVPNACPGSSTLYRTFTATDACGNATSAVQTIAQSDVEGPQPDPALLPADTLVSCDAVPATLDSAAFGTTDNCNTWTFAVVSDTIAGDCPFSYTRVDTYTFTDCDGNATEFVHQVMVEDVTAPIFDYVPATDTIPCTQDFPLPTDGEIWMAEASDNCSEVEVTWLDVIVPNACPGSSTLTRTFTAVDSCGNTTVESHNIVQVDEEAPQLDVAQLPQDTTVNCDAVPSTLDSLAFVVTDNCNTWTFDVSSDTLPGDCGPAYVRLDTYTFTDCDGNATEFLHTVTVQDTTAPLFLFFPSDDSLTCTEPYPSPTDSDLLLATAEDNCSLVDVSWNDLIVPGDCPGVDTLFRTFTALDSCGNVTSQVQTMFHFDNEGPIINVFPNDTTIDCDPVNEIGTLDSSFFAVEDNCNPWTFEVSTDDDGQQDSPCDYIRYDTYIFTDCSGNATSYVHEITVQDTTGPNITEEPADLYLMCPQEVPEFDTTLPVSDWMDDANLDITDDCDGDPAGMTATYEDEVAVYVDGTHYTLTRSWVFEDHCGNQTAYDQLIDVNEPQPVLPNAFSPPGANGGNGFNDTFVIENLGTNGDGSTSYPPCYWGDDGSFIYFQVFNRWGGLVYESAPGEMYRNDWDGKNSITDNQVVDGTYFVLLRFEDGRKFGSYVDVRKD